jgi:hypothetical protein
MKSLWNFLTGKLILKKKKKVYCLLRRPREANIFHWPRLQLRLFVSKFYCLFHRSYWLLFLSYTSLLILDFRKKSLKFINIKMMSHLLLIILLLRCVIRAMFLEYVIKVET